MRFFEVFVHFFMGYLFFYFALSSNYSIVPHTKLLWYKDVNDQNFSLSGLDKSKLPEFDLNHYIFKNKIFYTDKQGEVTHRVKTDKDYVLTASKKNYITYQKAGDFITMFNARGNAVWRYDTYSYPFLSPSGNRVLLLSTDNTSISILDDERNVILPQTFISSMILDFTFCEFNDKLLFGTTEGRVVGYDYQGNRVNDLMIDGSQYNYIKSVSISDKGEYFACLTGLAPEYLILFDKGGKTLWRQETARARRRKSSLYIDEINGQLIEQSERSLIVRHLRNGKVKFQISLDSVGVKSINYIKADASENRVVAIVNTEEKSYAVLFTKDGKILWTKTFEDPYLLHCQFNEEANAFLIQSSQNVYCYRFID